ncbi:hypothetical protein BZG02_07785 [Labilibaculum filiforme]|uniref:Uncharacterized protein n=1 Tax=Labilibaculum filiforme TaxID=1940526 RepID=A0A2N3I0S3_9BACT|nr:hypothetical protein [Labilibaculum filiforme]PKQ63902.1 hypothetical protein BZG02_07785 [Labilibaculum filiforme]
MDYQNDFETWKERIEALPLSEVKLPNQPIDEVTASAETLAIEAIKDKESLAKAGLDITFITDLTTLSGAVRYCQAEWMSEYRARQEAQKEWLEQSPEAYDLRDEMLHHFSFVFRNNENVNKKVMRIREGGGHADMIQDLIELAILGEKNPEPLKLIGVDTLLSKAKITSHNMSVLLAESNGSKEENSATKLMRDKAYTLLAEKMSTIREYGRYIFWKNEDRKKKYLND